MKTITKLTIGCFHVKGKYKNGKNFEDYTFEILSRRDGTKAVEDGICREYGKYNCTIADIRLIGVKIAEINLASEYLKAQKKSSTAPKYRTGVEK